MADPLNSGDAGVNAISSSSGAASGAAASTGGVKSRYLDINFAGRQSNYINEEQDKIRAAFMPCSFTTIQSLHWNPPAGGSGQPPFKVGRAAPFFSDFTYDSEPYGLLDEIRSLEKKEGIALQEAVAEGKPFLPVSAAMPAKYEGNFKYVPEPFDAVKDESTRLKWMAEKKILGVPFLPAGVQKALERPTRAMLTDIMTHLYRLLCEDWEEAVPTVFTTEEDLIVVYFNLKRIKNTAGIIAYMNVMEARNEAISKYDLHKVVEGWGVPTEDNHIMFAFRPPWVRAKVVAAGSDRTSATSSAAPIIAQDD